MKLMNCLGGYFKKKSFLLFHFIDHIDIAKDVVTDYKGNEDPLFYVSKVTGRGPLGANWRDEHMRSQTVSNEFYDKAPIKTPDNSVSDKPLKPLPKRIMCSYKLCRVEFKYWGTQTRVEQFIHDVG